MRTQPSSPRIECPVDLFEGCEQQIKGLTAAINYASTPQKKGRLARELLENLSTLLDCTAYDRNNFDCRLCRNLSTLRHKTATVISKVTAADRQPCTGAEE